MDQLLLLEDGGVQKPADNTSALIDLDEPVKIYKLTQFFEGDTRKWFAQVEEILKGAPDATQKTSILRVTPTSVFCDSGANVSGTFAEIRDRIIAHFDDTQDQSIRKLPEKQTLGDDRPSTAVRKLKELAPGNDEMVKTKFRDMRPVPFRVSMAAIKDASLDHFAEAADRMVDYFPIGEAQKVASTQSSSP